MSDNLVFMYSPPFSNNFEITCGSLGRIFEGTAQQMLDSLNLLKKLDPATFIFPGKPSA